MIPRISKPIAPQIELITRKVRAAERILETNRVLVMAELEGVIMNWTNAPNNGMYLSSELGKFANLLLHNSFDPGSACDLGGGLVGIGAIESLFFKKKVVSWEYDSRIHQKSVELWRNAGFPYDQIDIRCGDFLSQEADIKNFGFIYFFQPFMENFRFLMREKLLEASRGAVIAFHQLPSKKAHQFIFQPTDIYSSEP